MEESNRMPSRSPLRSTVGNGGFDEDKEAANGDRLMNYNYYRSRSSKTSPPFPPSFAFHGRCFCSDALLFPFCYATNTTPSSVIFSSRFFTYFRHKRRNLSFSMTSSAAMDVSGPAESARSASPLLPKPPARSNGGRGVAEEGEGMETLRRLVRRVKPFEHAGLLGFFVFTAALFVVLLCFVHLDRGWAWGGRGVGGSRALWGTGAELRRGGDGSDCDWFEGGWVWDEKYPLYKSTECGFMDLGFRCSENGRPDRFYTKWRWQPARCDLPRFNAMKMLEKLRNRRLVFVGDSIGRNQWESLLCMLAMAVSNKSSIYEVNGSPITKHMGFLVFKFEEYNCTVEYYRAPFLVPQSRAPPGLPEQIKTILRLDVLDWTSSRWKDADVLIFNTGHWWNYEKTIRSGCYFQEGSDVKMEMSVNDAYKRSVQTLFEWIHREVDRSKTHVVFRSYAPVHFRDGDWRTGGSCHLETLPDLSSSMIPEKSWAHFLEPFRNITRNRALEFDLLNVTQMTARRKDGHLSVFYLGSSGRAPRYKQDCSHWCLPGVPDTWNELLYALILRRDSTKYQNATIFNLTGVRLGL